MKHAHQLEDIYDEGRVLVTGHRCISCNNTVYFPNGTITILTPELRDRDYKDGYNQAVKDIAISLKSLFL